MQLVSQPISPCTWPWVWCCWSSCNRKTFVQDWGMQAPWRQNSENLPKEDFFTLRNSFGWIKNAWIYFQKTNLPFSPQESNTGSAHAWKRLKFKTWNPFLFFIAFISDRLQQTWNPEVLQHILNSLTSFPALPDHELEAIVTAGEVGYVREAVGGEICFAIYLSWHGMAQI